MMKPIFRAARTVLLASFALSGLARTAAAGPAVVHKSLDDILFVVPDEHSSQDGVRQLAASQAQAGPVYGNSDPTPPSLNDRTIYRFTGTLTVPSGAARLAIFSDDGATVYVNGVALHEAEGSEQPLPKLNRSLHFLKPYASGGSTWAAGAQVTVSVDYSNLRYGDRQGYTDVDGCTLFLYEDDNAAGDVLFDETFAADAVPILFLHRALACGPDGCSEPECVSTQAQASALGPVPDENFSTLSTDSSLLRPSDETEPLLSDGADGAGLGTGGNLNALGDDSPLPPPGEEIEALLDEGLGDARIRVVRLPNDEGYRIERWLNVPDWWLFYAHWELASSETVSKNKFEQQYFVSGQFMSTFFYREKVKTGLSGGARFLVRTANDAAGVTLFVAAVLVPGPDDAVWAALGSKYGLRLVGDAIFKKGKKLAGKELDDAVKVIKEEVEASKKTTSGAVKVPKSRMTLVKRNWTQAEWDKWFLKLPRQAAPTTRKGQYQRKYCGPQERQASGGGEQFWTDGIDGSQIIEAKCVVNPPRSPFIPGSDCPDNIRKLILDPVEDEFRRMGLIVADCENPLSGVKVVTNHADAVPYFRGLLQKYKVPGSVEVLPE